MWALRFTSRTTGNTKATVLHFTSRTNTKAAYEPRHDKTYLRRFVTRLDSNRSAQLQRLASLGILEMKTIGIILSRQWITQMLIRLCRGTDWSASLLFAYGIIRFFHYYRDQTWFFYALTSAGPRGRYWNRAWKARLSTYPEEPSRCCVSEKHIWSLLLHKNILSLEHFGENASKSSFFPVPIMARKGTLPANIWKLCFLSKD